MSENIHMPPGLFDLTDATLLSADELHTVDHNKLLEKAAATETAVAGLPTLGNVQFSLHGQAPTNSPELLTEAYSRVMGVCTHIHFLA